MTINEVLPTEKGFGADIIGQGESGAFAGRNLEN